MVSLVLVELIIVGRVRVIDVVINGFGEGIGLLLISLFGRSSFEVS